MGKDELELRIAPESCSEGGSLPSCGPRQQPVSLESLGFGVVSKGVLRRS